MYFPTNTCKRLKPTAACAPDDNLPLPSSLAEIAKIGGAREEIVIDIQSGSEDELVAVLTQGELSVWSVKPSLALCKIKRSHLSIRQHGINERVYWRDVPEWTLQDTPGLIVQTSKSRLLYYSLHTLPDSPIIYQMPTKHSAGPAPEFQAGVGEASDLPGLKLRTEGFIELPDDRILCARPTADLLLVSTAFPPALCCIPWQTFFNNHSSLSATPQNEATVIPLTEYGWLVNPEAGIQEIVHSSALQMFVIITVDGRAYVARDMNKAKGPDTTIPTPRLQGRCIYGLKPSAPLSSGRATPQTPIDSKKALQIPDEAIRKLQIAEGQKAVTASINERLSLIALGLANGTCQTFSVSPTTLRVSASCTMALREALKSTASHLQPGCATSIAWTSDGLALAVGWSNGYSIWSAFGRLASWSINGDVGNGDSDLLDRGTTRFEDHFLWGVSKLLWCPGDFELWIACPPCEKPRDLAIDEQLYIMPFARSAVAGIHSPDNTNHAFLQMEDRVLVYRGADQPDMSVINPESDVWQHIKMPSQYLATQWPIKLACISSDGRLIAIAGRRGLAHYNALSGRWKLFAKEEDESAFCVRGGMQWYGSFLLAAVDEGGRYKLRLYARDQALAAQSFVQEHSFEHPVVNMTIFDNSLLVYTTDNTLHHFLMVVTKDRATLRLCGSIGFEGVVRDPARVRGMSWLVPRAQQRFGDPADDLNVATIIFLIDDKLVLLRPRRAVREEVKYDLQVLADRIEFYWTHLSGIGTLENSLWGWNGKTIRVWLNALTIETSQSTPDSGLLSAREHMEVVKESLAIELDFYPLSVLMDKGIIVGIDLETSLRRTLDFALFRISTNTHLFLHRVLRFHLTRNQIHEAVLFASHYQNLIYFAHALEILLHDVLEEEADALISIEKKEATSRSVTPDIAAPKAVLPYVVEFLDHFEECLQVVVGCARKTEIARWKYLFDTVGNARDLFEECMARGRLKVAASYLLVLHNLEPIEQSSKDTVLLLKATIKAQDYQLGKELLRFLFSLDHSGLILRSALEEANSLPEGYAFPLETRPEPPNRSISAPPPIDIVDADEDHDHASRPDLHRSPSSPIRSRNSVGMGLGSLLDRVGLANRSQMYRST